MIDGTIKYGPIRSVGLGKTNELTITDKGFTLVGKAIPHGQLAAVRVTLDVPFGDIISHTKTLSCYVFVCKTHMVRFEHRGKDKAAIEYLVAQYTAAQQNLKQERFLRCSICGKVFTFSPAEEFNLHKELVETLNRRAQAGLTALSNLAASATQLSSAQSAQQMLEERISSLRRCPACKSASVTEITREEASRAAAPAAPAVPDNAAVEALKKFKDLLDMGAITQEEFDAKKKQLLGL